MKLKWYICTLVISLSLLTVIKQQHGVVPNQEIVLQFQDELLSDTHTKISITNIKQKLQDIGASSVEVITSENGLFRITYYSKDDVSTIKEKLLDKKLIVLSDADLHKPSEKSKKYNFEVYEINNAIDNHWDFDGQLVYQLQVKSDRSFQLDTYKFLSLFNAKNEYSTLKSKCKIYTSIDFIADNTSFNIPEVRAGPSIL